MPSRASRHRFSQAPSSAGGEPARQVSAWRENIESLVWAVALALVIRTFVMAPFKIPSGSMRPTLIEGDRILVNRFIYHVRLPRHGDIIVFRSPENPKRPFIKRVVAVGGETVEIRDGTVLVNGQPLQEAEIFRTNRYYNQGTYGSDHQVIHVPEGSFYVLGDNSIASHDSRWWGFVPRRLVIGHAMCVFWPPNRLRILR